MNVFVLPSWYPSATNPTAGIFVREQVMAVARARPEFTITVGTWGHLDASLSLRSVTQSARSIVWRIRQPACRWTPLAANVHQVVSPALSWTLAVAGGNVRGILNATRRNLAEAERRVGAQHLIHAHVGFPAGWIAAQIASERGIPFVVTEHMSPFPFPALRGSARAMDRLRHAFSMASEVVAVSPSLAARMRELNMRCTSVLPNLVDLDRFVVAPPLKSTPFVFLSLGGPNAQKGTDLVIRALAHPVMAKQDVRVMIGGGADASSYKQLARKLGVEAQIEWLGTVKPAEVPEVMTRCHALVQPSRHESFGVVLIEALASGRPVIGTRCGGPESIVNETNGRLVEVDDVPALADAMKWMMSHATGFDPEVLRADATRRFSATSLAESLIRLYESTVANPRA